LALNGGTLRLANAGGPNGETFASLSLTDNSTIDLAMSSLTFNTLGTVENGKSLTVEDWSSSSSPGYAFRFVGDDTSNSTFMALMSETTIDGVAASYRFDGTYTDVSSVPLPAGLPLLMSALGALGLLGRRRNPA
jgi:hypothetical protein